MRAKKSRGIGRALVANQKDLQMAVSKRNLFSNKLQNGRVMIIGGSENFHGAPALASTAAYNLLASLRTGAGYATAFVPKSIADANRKVSANVIVRSLSNANICAKDLKFIKENI